MRGSTDCSVKTAQNDFGGISHTESQNGRGWKGPLWATQSNSLLKQGHPEQAAQDRI